MTPSGHPLSTRVCRWAAIGSDRGRSQWCVEERESELEREGERAEEGDRGSREEKDYWCAITEAPSTIAVKCIEAAKKKWSSGKGNDRGEGSPFLFFWLATVANHSNFKFFFFFNIWRAKFLLYSLLNREKVPFAPQCLQNFTVIVRNCSFFFSSQVEMTIGENPQM